MVYNLTRMFFVIVLKVLFRYKITGMENIPREGPVIVAANHRSYLDPIMVSIAVRNRKISFMAKDTLFRYPVFGAFIRRLNAFPVRKGVGDKAAIVRSLKALMNGEVLVIFPEGTRYREGGMGPAYPGVTAMAVKTGATIVPAGIIGTEKVMPDGVKIPRLPKIIMNVGKPMRVEKASGKSSERKELEERLAEHMMDEIADLAMCARSR